VWAAESGVPRGRGKNPGKKVRELNEEYRIPLSGRFLRLRATLSASNTSRLSIEIHARKDRNNGIFRKPIFECEKLAELTQTTSSFRYLVAVGIEKAADALALVSMGCDYGQGFLLGQPKPEERFVSLLRQRAATQGHSLDGATSKTEKRPA
jgi:hypothetical protein